MQTDKRTRLLVVEDNEDDTFLLTRQLAKAHLDDCVTVIANGAEALLFLLRTTPPPLGIFLDLNLPGLLGTELLKKIRQHPKLAAVPIIIMTSSINPKDMEECDKYGVTAYLAKPISLSAFIKTVTSLFPEATAPSLEVQKN